MLLPIRLHNFNNYNTYYNIIHFFLVIFRVYCADHSYCTLRFPLHTTSEIIKICAADKLQLMRTPEDLILVEVKSNGERSIFPDNDVSIPTGLSINGRLFVSIKNDIDALVTNY